MSKGKNYLSVVTVKSKAPEGWKPRLLTFKFGYVSDTNSEQFQNTAKEECIKTVKEQLEEQNEGITLSVSASIDITKVVCVLGYNKERKG